MTDEKLQEIEKRAAAATPGPWVVGSVTGSCSMDHGRGPMGHGQGDCQYDYRIETKGTARHCVSSVALVEVVTTCEEYGAIEPANADFIANARTDVPALCAEVRRLAVVVVENAVLRRDVADAYKDRDEWRVQLSRFMQAVGLASTAIPSMVVDPENPVSMMQRVVARVAALECDLAAALDRCPVHDSPKHGAEAEELRKEVERCLDVFAGDSLAINLRRMLDRVDARDSLAHLENVERLQAERDAALSRIADLEQAALANETSFAACQADRAALQDQLAEVTRERDEARDRIRRLQNEVVEHCENLNDRVHDLHVERVAKEVVLDKLAEVTAQAAVMRVTLDSALAWLRWSDGACAVCERVDCNCGTDDVRESMLAALAPDAGRALVAEVTALREVVAKARRYACGADSKGYPCECLFCSALAKLDALKVPK
jgi:hypothetical protein